jgi:hypothetical protein
MNCQHCGNEFWASRVIGDSDFCSPLHRRRFHDHLRAAMQLIEHSTAVHATGLAPFHSNLAASEVSHAGRFAEASYSQPIRVPGLHFIATAEALDPELLRSFEPQAEEATRFEMPAASFAATANLQLTESDERPLRISAILAGVRQELAQRRGKAVPASRSRRMERVIELPVAV